MKTFGPAFSRALRDGCSDLGPYLPGGVGPEWVLSVLAYESGLDPAAVSSQGARGLFQKMPVNGVPYSVTDPAEQLRDAFRFWLAMLHAFYVPLLPTLGHFYCLNLAPARLSHGRATAETKLYVSPSAAYRANRQLDVAKKGYIVLADLEPPLLKARKALGARIDAELAALLAVDVK